MFKLWIVHFCNLIQTYILSSKNALQWYPGICQVNLFDRFDMCLSDKDKIQNLSATQRQYNHPLNTQNHIKTTIHSPLYHQMHYKIWDSPPLSNNNMSVTRKQNSNNVFDTRTDMICFILPTVTCHHPYLLPDLNYLCSEYIHLFLASQQSR